MTSYPKIIDRIVETIREHKSFCVVGHVRPDGDCVGSQLALAIALRNDGKRVCCWNEDPIPAKYRFLDPDGLFEKPRSGKKFDCVIAADCASFPRLGAAGKYSMDRKVLINIDHHESNPRYGDINWISAREPSCGELIFRLLKAARWPITKSIADNLFAAVSTDTGSFQYSTTRPGTFHTGAELVTRGADLAK
ncbi:MAG: DHH family phosphoesterase, partial [Limisphaerales bacterium]